MLRIDDGDFLKLISYIKEQYGINLYGKRTLVESRLSGMMTRRGFKNYSDYLKYCFSDVSGGEMRLLVNALTTNHTFFMREPEHFIFMRDTVLPYLKEKNGAGRSMRIWSAACSSGEEPYTAAIFISEFLNREKPLWDTRILATDISVGMLSAAQKGIYPKKSAELLPAGLLAKYFTSVDGEHIKISADIRKEVIFKEFNLMDAIPFKKAPFDIIFCRNVMIYFENDVKAGLLERLYNVLAPGGYLFIGHSESMPRSVRLFENAAPAVYRRPLNG